MDFFFNSTQVKRAFIPKGRFVKRNRFLLLKNSQNLSEDKYGGKTKG